MDTHTNIEKLKMKCFLVADLSCFQVLTPSCFVLKDLSSTTKTTDCIVSPVTHKKGLLLGVESRKICINQTNFRTLAY